VSGASAGMAERVCGTGQTGIRHECRVPFRDSVVKKLATLLLKSGVWFLGALFVSRGGLAILVCMRRLLLSNESYGQISDSPLQDFLFSYIQL